MIFFQLKQENLFWRNRSVIVYRLHYISKILVAIQSRMVKRTKTMVQTVEDGQEFIKTANARLKKIEKTKKKPQVVAKKKQKKIAAKAEPKPPARKVVKQKKETKQKKEKKEKKEKKQEKGKKQKDAPAKLKTKTISRMSVEGPSAGIVDVVFCCDTTGSMCSYLQNTKTAIQTIMRRIYDKCKPQEVSTKFGFVAYRDHPPQDHTFVTRIHPLDNFEKTLNFIKKQDAAGGGDFPEAVFDGLLVSAKDSKWRKSFDKPILRYIFHIADAPPHGKQFYSSDPKPAASYPGPTIDQVAEEINKRQIHYRLIKIGGQLQQMANAFKRAFFNYEESVIDNAKDLDIRISDMIIRELMPDQ